MDSQLSTHTTADDGKGRKAILLAIATVAIEGYDLSLFAIFSVAIATAFFPAGNPTAALLMAVGTLGVGYVMRPIGGILLGAFADRRGRSAAMALTVLLMASSTGAIGLIPSYAAIGVAAPLFVVLARLVQGVSAGGATPGSLSYLIESAPAHRRGYYGSWQQAAQVAALLLASGVGATAAAVFPRADLEDWGWRLPFLLALLFGPLGLTIRRHLPETRAFVESSAAPRQSLPAMLRGQWRTLVAGIGLLCLHHTTTFVLLFYLPTYAQTQIGLAPREAFLASSIATGLLAPLCLVAGMLSDRWGRKPVMVVSASMLGLLAFPLFAMVIASRNFATLLLMQCLFSVAIAGYTGPANAVLGEMFPTSDRATGISIVFNLSVLCFGAFGPLAVTWMMASTGNPLAIGVYIIAAALVSLVSLVFIRESRDAAI